MTRPAAAALPRRLGLTGSIGAGKSTVAALLHLQGSDVGVSFKTSEGLAPDHVQTRVTVLLGRVP